MVGWVVGSKPGSLVAYIAVIFVIPVLFGGVFGQWGRDVAKFMPSRAGASFIGSLAEPAA